MDEMYILIVIGFGALIGAVLYLRPITKELVKIDAAWFKNYPLFLLALIILLVITLPLTLNAVYYLPASNYPSGSSGLIAVESVGMPIALILLLTLFFGITVGSLAMRMGKYRGKLALVLCAILVSGAFVAPYVGAISGVSAGPPISNTRVVITQINLQISYPGGLSLGYLGDSQQAIGFSGSGNATFSGGEQWNTWFVLPYEGSNPAGHEITSLTTSTPGFSVVSTEPKVPFMTQEGIGLNVSFVLQVPNTPYSGPVDILISTT